MTSASADAVHMSAALALAARGLGDTWPNPAVGCVIVKDDVVIARGWTQSGGRPHAEEVALARAGAAARGATAYVSLEPCSYRRVKNPPCADALLAAGIGRVVISAGDPDPRVAGGGIARLMAAGVPVVEGVLRAEGLAANRGFFLRVGAGRPMFALKTATSLDGRIATASGESQWITGPTARAAVQVLRARYDAILVGSETALADDPALTCRLDGYAGRPKVRIVLDRRLRLPPTAGLVRTARDAPTWVITAEASVAQGAALTAAGVDVIAVPDAEPAAFAVAAARVLAERGLTRVLIEGGGRVAASFLSAGLIDEIAWFRAGRLMGDDARPAIGGLGLGRLSDTPRFAHSATLALGADTLDIFTRAD